MENQVQNKQTEGNRQGQGLVANPQIYLNAERGVLTHRLGNDLKIEMSVNLYKSILGIPFEKKEPAETPEEMGPRRNVFGLIARPAIYFSKDKNYLIHSVLGIRISKHVNYYKKILGAEYTPKIRTA